MAGQTFDERSCKRIARAVIRSEQRHGNDVLPWRTRRIGGTGGKPILWARTPATELVSVTPVADCMIAPSPIYDYGDPDYQLDTVYGSWAWCAGIFPDTWYPVFGPPGSRWFLAGGAWFLAGVAVSACSAGGYFSLDVGTVSNPCIVEGVHSPAGSIVVDSNVYIAFKGGEGEYMAILDEC
jgi:hypothetical protein